MKKKSPGSLFLSYLIIGFLVLLTIILAGNSLAGIISKRLIISLGILLGNFLVVLLFSSAIVRNKDLLADSDSADMAYYLGFSLTVGALALSFMVDLLFSTSSSAAQRGQFVENALSIFGAGLLATLFGLCAKIYISSMQTSYMKEPEQLATEFKEQIGDFSRLLGEQYGRLADSYAQSTYKIKEAGEQGASSMTSLAEELFYARNRIREEFSVENIEQPMHEFIQQLGLLKQPLSVFVTSVGQLNNALSSTDALVAKILQSTKSLNETVTVLSSSVDSLTRETSTLGLQQADLSIQTKATKTALRTLGSNFEKLTQDHLPGVTEKIESLRDQTLMAATGLSKVSVATASIPEQITTLTTALDNAKTKLTELSAHAGQLCEHFSDTTLPISSLTTHFSQLGNVSSALPVPLEKLKEHGNAAATSMEALNLKMTNLATQLSQVERHLKESSQDIRGQ